MNKLKSGVEINLQLRSEILDIALNLEQSVNSLLLILLSIDNPRRKAITNKSGNLSFKNKIDLLFDLDVLNNNEHKKFLLLMEFRNQFLHNIECNSFKNAVELLGDDKKKKLLKFDDSDNKHDIEFRYQSAFRNLNIKSIKIISEKIEDKINKIKDNRKIHENLLDGQIFFINQYFDILIKILRFCENNFSEIPEVIQLINQLNKIITDDMNSAFTSEKFIQIKKEFKESSTTESIEAYLKKR